MPVEIRELIIRAVTSLEPQAPVPQDQAPQVDPDAMVQECVRQVLRILKKQQDR